MIKMVECPNCHGRGTVGYGVKGEKGVAFFDFECDFCKGRCWVSKKRAEKYERDKEAERKGTKASVETIHKGAGTWTRHKR